MSRLGQYELIEEIGRGGMGVVYRGVDPIIRRHVAIKTIRLGEMGDASEREFLQERLFREAQSAGILSHPGIVTIYQVGQEAEVTFIAMEFIDGPNLARLLTEGALPIERMIEILTQTAAALDYAHQHGVIHRDIKPANIMLTSDGRAKIADFGVAKLISSSLTRTGMTVGSPSYMSPEQVQGKAVDGRADQYSLAVVAYEMLTREKPFQAETFTALVYKIVFEEPSLERLAHTAIGSRVEQVLRKALSKQADNRFATCSEFAQALADASRAPVTAIPARPAQPVRPPQHIAPPQPVALPQPVHAPGGGSGRNLAVALGSTVLVLGLGVGSYLLLRSDHGSVPDPQDTPVARVEAASQSKAAPQSASVVPQPPPAVKPAKAPAERPTASSAATTTAAESPAPSPTPTATEQKAFQPPPPERRNAPRTEELPPPSVAPSPAPVPKPVIEEAPATSPISPPAPAPAEPAAKPTAPTLILQSPPSYTEAARKAGIQGAVLLALEVDENGQPDNIRVVRPLHAELDIKAIEAVQRWRFRPGTLEGRPVRTSVTAEVQFRLVGAPSQGFSLKKPSDKKK